MPKIKYNPHQQDLAAIKEILKTKSWGRECILCTLLDGSASYLLVPNLYVLCPCKHEEYDNFKATAMLRAAVHGVKAGIAIVDGCSQQECERIWWDAHQNSIIIEWLDVKNSVFSTKLLLRSLDGIDWGRSIISAINGADAKPVFDWES